MTVLKELICRVVFYRKTESCFLQPIEVYAYSIMACGRKVNVFCQPIHGILLFAGEIKFTGP
jgi:hypothetical protein